eukprot:Blabericola_migrator_1__5077@NODE_2629_length_2514_cov_84_416428_g1649_i0_p1_GENE_NODE_2629_length_2514_cov_84_416428_g1649_i0NODE_2629_length_2514_cov_84_416428_g1649_i0_p1_ORF_typecomplete_len338_score45_98_NODE_2629_length_2514_cov_84_416428_g1649_i012362249
MRSTFLVALIGSASALPARTQTDPVYSCAPGFNLIGKTCERPITAPAQIVCNQGVLQGDICVVETPHNARCPPGTTKQGKQCVAPVVAPARPLCPPGFLDTGLGCEITEQLPLIEVCDIGSREGPQCATVDVAPYIINQYCPPGFEEHAKGGCWKSTVYDCTPLQTGKGGLAGLRGLVGKEQGMSVPVNNAKVNVIQQTCERKESAAMITDRQCPAGYTDTGAGCLLKNYFPTTTKCSNGGPVETCFTTRPAAYTYDCTPGTILQGQTCHSQTVHPEEIYCPIGMDNGFACVQQFPAAHICEPGLQLNGNICIGTETAPPQVTVTVTCTGKNCAGAH